MKSKCEWYVKRDGAMFRGYVDCKLEDGTEYTWRSVPMQRYENAQGWARMTCGCFRGNFS